MEIRSDIAEECCAFAAAATPDAKEIEGVRAEVREHGPYKVHVVSIETSDAASRVGKPVGRYHTVTLPPFSSAATDCEGAAEVVAEELKRMLPALEGATLVCGLGNDAITPDALGPKVIEETLATRHISGALAKEAGLEGLRPVAAITPGVLGRTGIKTSEIVEGIVSKITPGCLIVIDALAARALDRLGCTVQISDVGITPGSGVGGMRGEISRATLGIPVIAIGVPTVVDARTMAYDLIGRSEEKTPDGWEGETMMVTPKEIDLLVARAAKVISKGINLALQPELSSSDLDSLTAT